MIKNLKNLNLNKIDNKWFLPSDTIMSVNAVSLSGGCFQVHSVYKCPVLNLKGQHKHKGWTTSERFRSFSICCLSRCWNISKITNCFFTQQQKDQSSQCGRRSTERHAVHLSIRIIRVFISFPAINVFLVMLWVWGRSHLVHVCLLWNCWSVRWSSFKENQTINLLLAVGPPWKAGCPVCCPDRSSTCVHCGKCPWAWLGHTLSYREVWCVFDLKNEEILLQKCYLVVHIIVQAGDISVKPGEPMRSMNCLCSLQSLNLLCELTITTKAQMLTSLRYWVIELLS